MQSAALFFTALGLLSVYGYITYEQARTYTHDNAQVVAHNFIAYRNEAWNLLYPQLRDSTFNPESVPGIVADMETPKMRPWQILVEESPEARRCYIYGDMGAGTVNIRELSQSWLLGINIEQRMEPLGMALPQAIPEGSVVSVLQVTRDKEAL